MQNVFVASDFLPYATQALYQAYDVAQAACAALTCFHALEKFPEIMRDILFPYAALGSDEVDILNEVRSGIEDRGRKYLENVMKSNASHVRLKVDFARDSMAKSILHAASECNADLIFSGSYGTKPHTTGSIGSMAASFVAYTRVPLYLIKDPAKRGPHKKILVAFLDPAYNAALLAWAVSFAMFYPESDVEIVTPIPDLAHADPNGDFQGLIPNERQINAASERVTHRAKLAVQALNVPFVYETHASQLSFKQHIPIMPAASAVLSVAESIGADLIAIPTAPPSLNADNALREITRTITEYANQNCLVIPSTFLK